MVSAPVDSQPWHERYRGGRWLSPGVIVFASLVSLAAGLAGLAVGIATAGGTLDALGRPIGTDFTSLYSAGRLALEGRAAQAYDWTVLRQAQADLHGGTLFYPWSYPPLFLLAVAPLAALPYLPALAVWQGASLAAATAVFSAILPGRLALLCGLASPVVLVCLVHGQTGFLVAALFAGGVLALPRRPALAGLLFGLLAFKPHIALLVPVCLVAAGSWRAVASAATTVLAGGLLTLALWGPAIWEAFLAGLVATEAAVLRGGGPGFHNFTSLFAALRGWGVPAEAAYGAQAGLAAAAAIACVPVWRGRADMRLKGAVLLSGALLCAPYTLDYDLVLLGMAAAFLAAHGLARGFGPWQATLVAVAWIAPTLGDVAFTVTSLPVPIALAASGSVFLTAVRASRAAHRAGRAEPPRAAPVRPAPRAGLRARLSSARRGARWPRRRARPASA